MTHPPSPFSPLAWPLGWPRGWLSTRAITRYWLHYRMPIPMLGLRRAGVFKLDGKPTTLTCLGWQPVQVETF